MASEGYDRGDAYGALARAARDATHGASIGEGCRVMSRFRRDQSGANAVEFALLLPILIVLLFGILYGGLAYNRSLALTQSAREGARFAATLPGAVDGTSLDSGWFDTVVERIEYTSTRSLGPQHADRYICVRVVDEDENVYIADIGAGSYGNGDCDVDSTSVQDRERVEVVVRREAVLELIFYRFPLNLRSDAVARLEAEIE